MLGEFRHLSLISALGAEVHALQPLLRQVAPRLFGEIVDLLYTRFIPVSPAPSVPRIRPESF